MMLMKFKDAAKYVGISTSYLRMLKHDNKIPFVQPSGPKGNIYFDMKDLDKWIAEQKRKAI
jgi:excisionase family DNA binding protein